MMLAYVYLGLIIVVVYIGAIAILFLFVIMMLDTFDCHTFFTPSRHDWSNISNSRNKLDDKKTKSQYLTPS